MLWFENWVCSCIDKCLYRLYTTCLYSYPKVSILLIAYFSLLLIEIVALLKKYICRVQVFKNDFSLSQWNVQLCFTYLPTWHLQCTPFLFINRFYSAFDHFIQLIALSCQKPTALLLWLNQVNAFAGG